LKGSEAADAISLLEKSARESSGSTSQIVVATKTGKVTDPQVRQRVSAALARVSRLPHVGTVGSPYGPGAGGQISTAGSDPSSTTTRKAYDLLPAGFGPGFNGPLQLVARVDRTGQPRQFEHVVKTVGHVAGVQSATPPVVVVVGGGVAVAEVVPTGSPQDASTSALVASLRRQVLPAASQGKVRVLAVEGGVRGPAMPPASA